VDPTRGVLFEFGEPAPGAWRVRRNQQLIGRTVSAAERRRLAREFRHRWGVGYQLPDRIQSLFADGAGRVYLLTELKSLHVFDVRGQPLARYHYNWDEHFLAREAAGLREAERLEGPVIYVDFDGRIYTQQVHWEAQDAQGRFPQTLNVYEWSPRVRRVFSAPLPESGCVVGVDGRGAVYYLEFERRRVYRIGREGESRLVFSPREHYADWVRREREAWLAEHPERREAADRYPGMGPRVGHVCHVDREGHLYLTLVGAKEFRIDRIRLDP